MSCIYPGSRIIIGAYVAFEGCVYLQAKKLPHFTTSDITAKRTSIHYNNTINQPTFTEVIQDNA
jgi:hypothetical protein